MPILAESPTRGADSRAIKAGATGTMINMRKTIMPTTKAIPKSGRLMLLGKKVMSHLSTPLAIRASPTVMMLASRKKAGQLTLFSNSSQVRI